MPSSIAREMFWAVGAAAYTGLCAGCLARLPCCSPLFWKLRRLAITKPFRVGTCGLLISRRCHCRFFRTLMAFGRIVVQCPRPRRLSLDKDDMGNL
ncbi:unnamed protein product [Spirodela intermedia]|uniref:Uncharacterized protein n=1 Tax=Spirodela intermedia TaxID=51605 RepID=A0A7I8KRP0_SPIIN|nr:unnamed protein product [Spirodela intermedia]